MVIANKLLLICLYSLVFCFSLSYSEKIASKLVTPAGSLLNADVPSIRVSESINQIWREKDFYHTTATEIFLYYYHQFLKDEYKLVHIDFNEFKKKTIPVSQIRELKIPIPVGSVFEQGTLVNEQSMMYIVYELNKYMYSIYLYDVNTGKNKLVLTKLLYSFPKINVLDNGNIAITGDQNIILLDKSSFHIIREIRLPKDLLNRPGISHSGNKLVYITQKGVFASDIEFMRPKFLLASKFIVGKTNTNFGVSSVMWSGGDKKIVYSVGYAEEPLGIGFINPDGTDYRSFYIRSETYESFSNGTSILHDNFIIDTLKKEINELPSTPIYRDEIKHLYIDSEWYKNCSPSLNRLVHIKSDTNYIDNKEDDCYITDFTNKIEYEIPEANKYRFTFISWAPSSEKFVYKLENDEDLRFIFANLGE